MIQESCESHVINTNEQYFSPSPYRVDCRTRSAGSASSGAINVQIAINGQQMTVTSSGQFSYLVSVGNRL